VPQPGISRFIPLIVVAALLLALAIAFGPGAVRAWQFRSTVNRMLSDLRTDCEGRVPNYVLTDQKQEVAKLLANYGANQYVRQIRSLKLTSYFREGDHIWATVTAKYDVSGQPQFVGQGKLRWQWRDKKWQLDLIDSYIAPFSASGEPQWIPVTNYEALTGIGQE
jgi:hypothetical protein